jgi:hypothetical protein
MLRNAGAPEVPDEYLQFLAITDGMSAGLVEFYGAKAKERALGAYAPPDLFLANKDRRELFPERAILGSAALFLFAWDAAAGGYFALARPTLAPARFFPTLAELFAFAKEQI